MKQAFSSLLFICLCFLVSAQNSDLRFDKISSEIIKIQKGLSQNSVNCIFQDSKGYIWVGTWDGLNKYDGYKSSTYNMGIGEVTNELSNSTIYSLYEDFNGHIWVGTEGGLHRFDRKTQDFFQIKSRDINQINSDTIKVISGDDFGNLWIGTDKGLNRYSTSTGKNIAYRHNPKNSLSVASDIIQSLLVDKSGSIWVGTNRGLSLYDEKNNSFTNIYFNKNPYDPLNSVKALVLDEKTEVLWIGTEGGLVKYRYNSHSYTIYSKQNYPSLSFSPEHINALCLDKFGLLWIGTFGQGLFVLDPISNIINPYSYNVDDNSSLSNNFITAIMEDKSGVVWIGTSYKGLNKVNRYGNKFRHYYHIAQIKNSLSDNLIWTIAADQQDKIWIGTDDGINVFDPQKQSFTFIKHQKNNPNSLSSNSIRKLFFDKDQQLWIGTFDQGVSLYNLKTKKYKHFYPDPQNPKALNGSTVYPIAQDMYGDIWVGTTNGLHRFDKNTQTFVRYLNDSKNPNSISHNVIYAILPDSKGNLWVGTNNGLNMINLKTQKNRIFKHNPGVRNSLSSSRIFSIYEDKEGYIWIGTLGGGLNRFDPQKGSFIRYTEKDGLANNIINDILSDELGYLWLSTNYGLSRFEKKTGKIVNFDVKDGIQSYEYNMGAAFKTRYGELYFGGMNGFNCFYPTEIKKNSYIPPLVISDFKVFNDIRHHELHDMDTVFLNYDENFFSMSFAALDYSNPAKNKLSYKLENYERNWNFSNGEIPFANYTKVNPGTYIFRLKGSNNDGVWNEKGISLVIIISPAWYDTFVAKFGFSILILLIISLIIYSQYDRVRRKHKLERQMLEFQRQLFELEQKALRLQMNPHFIFNSLNSIQSFVINNNTDKAIHYLAKFAQLMRLILYNSRESYISVKDELKTLSIYMDIEKLRFDNKFDYSIDVDEYIDDEFIAIPPMLIQPYVENAILHGVMHLKDTGHITISLKLLNKDTLFCSIIDNGVGRKKANEIKENSGIYHKSKGMSITKERLELLNLQNKTPITVQVIDLYDSDLVATGTKVEIVMPFIEI